jgi:hypothetical protein
MGIDIEPGDTFWATSASSVWGNYIGYPRTVGWAAAFGRMTGLHVHGYLRWHWHEYSGGIPGPDRMFHSVAAISYAQSVSHGRYLAGLLRMLDLAKARKIDVADMETELATVVGPRPDALLHMPSEEGWSAKRQGVEGVQVFALNEVSYDADVHEAAKVRVLELIVRPWN